MIGRSIKGANFKGLMAYLVDVSRDLPPEAIRIRNLGSLETAVPEMVANAARSSRVRRPVGHLVVCFDAAERRDAETRMAIAERFLEILGLDDHQAVIVDHTLEPGHLRTDRHGEIHIEVNRIGLDGKVAESLDRFDYATVERAAATTASEFGMTPVPGRFNTIASERFGPALATRDPASPAQLSQEARGYRSRTGDGILSEALRADDDLRKALIAARRNADWQAFESAFFDRGYRLAYAAKVKGRSPSLSSGMIVIDRSDPKRRCGISSIARANCEKWGLPSLITGKGTVDGASFLPMGVPPAKLIGEGHRRLRGQNAQPETPTKPENLSARRKSAPSLKPKGFDRDAAYRAFKRQFDDDKAWNAAVEADRRAQHAALRRAGDQEFQAIVVSAKRRRKLVKSFFGWRSPIAKLWNFIADRAVDDKLARLKAEQAQRRKDIDIAMRLRRRHLPLWTDFLRAARDAHAAQQDQAPAIPPTQSTTTQTPDVGTKSIFSDHEQKEHANPKKISPTQIPQPFRPSEGGPHDNPGLDGDAGAKQRFTTTTPTTKECRPGHPSSRREGECGLDHGSSQLRSDSGHSHAGGERGGSVATDPGSAGRHQSVHAVFGREDRGDEQKPGNHPRHEFAQRKLLIARCALWARNSLINAAESGRTTVAPVITLIQATLATANAAISASSSEATRQGGGGGGGGREPSGVLTTYALSIAVLARARHYSTRRIGDGEPSLAPKASESSRNDDVAGRAAQTPTVDATSTPPVPIKPIASKTSTKPTPPPPLRRTSEKSAAISPRPTDSLPREPEKKGVGQKPSGDPSAAVPEFNPAQLQTAHARRLASTLLTTHNEKIFGMAADCLQAALRLKFGDRALVIQQMRAWARRHPDQAKAFITDYRYFPYSDLRILHDRLRQL